MPRVLADYLGLVFYFWSNEFSGKNLEPIHVHRNDIIAEWYRHFGM
jgi:hypothetical protein